MSGSNDILVSLMFPYSKRLTLLGRLQTGSGSLFEVGGRIYPGALYGKKEARNPDGDVGEPVVAFTVGRGGQGIETLPTDVLNRVVARSDTAFLASLDSVFVETPVSDSIDAEVPR